MSTTIQSFALTIVAVLAITSGCARTVSHGDETMAENETDGIRFRT